MDISDLRFCWGRPSSKFSIFSACTIVAVFGWKLACGEDLQRESEDLLSLLAVETELATKSGMNADFVPGMASILDGEDLRMRGVRTVWEALSLVPGISQGLEMTGDRQVLSRGVGYGYASGNLKIMLDGVSMNSSLLATANPVLNIPIEQVERIEVIRGPGSSVHGEYAYAGVINVITRKRDRSARFQFEEGGDSGAGAIWYWDDPERDLRFSLNLAGLEGDGAGVEIDEDSLFQIGQAHLSNAPGETNEAHRYKAGFANLNWGDSFLALKLIRDDYGDHYGINHFLPPPEHELASRQQFVSLQLGRDLYLADGLRAQVRLEYLQAERDRRHLYVFPASYLADRPIYMNQDYRETRYLGALDLHWRPATTHSVLIGLEASEAQVDEATWEWQNLPFPIPSTWLDEGRDRSILSAVVQDEYRPNDSLTFTGTLRYDDYSDVGSFLSPRLAAVWRVDVDTILKLQYAKAFRPPTFYELEYSAGGSIESSEISTYELGYILTKPDWVARLILFRSTLTDPILFDEVEGEGYINSQDARLQGVEFEYERRFGAFLKVEANLSYVDAVRTDSDSVLPGGASMLANLGLIWRPFNSWSFAIQWRHVGERHRFDSDPRSDLGSYDLFDLTLSYQTPIKGFYLRSGIKNLFDSEVYYLDQLTSYGGVDLIYPDGYLRPGRRCWITVGYNF